MKSISRSLFEKSISAVLASTELYNKPDFFYHEKSFAILAVNAWELLLKARILQLSSNSLNSITQYEIPKLKSGIPSKIKKKIKNRAGNIQTVGIFKAYDLLVIEYSEPLSDAKKKIEKWRRYYNEERPHSSIGMKTPNAFEKELTNSEII